MVSFGYAPMVGIVINTLMYCSSLKDIQNRNYMTSIWMLTRASSRTMINKITYPKRILNHINLFRVDTCRFYLCATKTKFNSLSPDLLGTVLHILVSYFELFTLSKKCFTFTAPCIDAFKMQHKDVSFLILTQRLEKWNRARIVHSIFKTNWLF